MIQPQDLLYVYDFDSEHTVTIATPAQDRQLADVLKTIRGSGYDVIVERDFPEARIYVANRELATKMTDAINAQRPSTSLVLAKSELAYARKRIQGTDYELVSKPGYNSVYDLVCSSNPSLAKFQDYLDTMLVTVSRKSFTVGYHSNSAEKLKILQAKIKSLKDDGYDVEVVAGVIQAEVTLTHRGFYDDTMETFKALLSINTEPFQVENTSINRKCLSDLGASFTEVDSKTLLIEVA